MEMTTIYVLSQILVIINYTMLMITYQLKKRKTILIFNFIAMIAMGLSYICLSAWSGLAMVFVALIRNILFFMDERNEKNKSQVTRKDRIMLILLYGISILFGILTYDGVLSLMSVLATMLYTYSVWQKNQSYYKILGIPVSMIWMIYNVYIGSIFGVILEGTLLSSAIIGMLREKKELLRKH